MEKILPIVAKPFVKLCVRNALRLGAVLEALKATYVEVAKEELELQGKPATASAVSAMTGLHRKDAARLLKDGTPRNKDYDLMTRVLGKWQGSSKYTTKSGQPRVLSAQGNGSEFFGLVRSLSADLNPYTVLNELIRIGSVERTARGGVRIASRVYVPKGDTEQGMQLLARDMDLLAGAVEENLRGVDKVPNLHITTAYDNIPGSQYAKIRKWLLAEGSAFHKRIRSYLSRFDKDINPAGNPAGKERIEVSVGSFSSIQAIRKGKGHS